MLLPKEALRVAQAAVSFWESKCVPD